MVAPHEFIEMKNYHLILNLNMNLRVHNILNVSAITTDIITYLYFKTDLSKILTRQ